MFRKPKPWTVIAALGVLLVVTYISLRDEMDHLSSRTILTYNKATSTGWFWGEGHSEGKNELGSDGMIPRKTDIEVNGHNISFFSPKNPVNPKRLKVHVIFHSHVDPGWLKTFEEYYQQEVHQMLHSIVRSLNKYPRLRFIWSETSFLERWWRDANQTSRETMKSLVSSGRLEISGGSWVMTDEATPLFYATIENMIEGHQFVYKELGVRPNTSWSVDPFGHGSMMPHLLPKAGINHMVIGRFHDHVKQKLRERQNLRWTWQNMYHNMRSEAPRVNSLPFLVYTTPNACKNEEVCKCYHMGPSSRMSCNGPKISEINENNIHLMSELLLQQYRITQELYGTEEMLIAVGDDFFFVMNEDFDVMYNGYVKIMDYVNNKPEFNAEMRFSTVSDFFNSIKDVPLPSLKGDFFPYTSAMDKPHPWWTGFYVHRPYYKTMERRLQNDLRTLDMLLVLTRYKDTQFNKKLTSAKRDFSLYQHHDGITGTSKPHVMKDYGARMEAAHQIYEYVLADVMKKWTGGNLNLYNRAAGNRTVLSIQKDKLVTLLIFNPSPQPILETIRILANVGNVHIMKNNKTLVYQARKFKNFELTFPISLRPLDFTKITIGYDENAPGSQFVIKNNTDEMKMKFNKDGVFKGFQLDSKSVFPLRIDFYEMEDTGGAYVFASNEKKIKVVPTSFNQSEGPLMNRYLYKYTTGLKMKLLHEPGSNIFDIEVKTNLSTDRTLILSFSSEISNEHFYTDANGLFHMGRKFDSSMPYEANFYPVASSAFIEDEDWRLTVITGQSTGATSDKEGGLDLMVDRRVTGDDGKGLSNNDAFDDRSVEVRYRVIVEKKKKSNPVKSTKSIIPEWHGLSESSQSQWNEFIYTPTILYSEETVTSPSLPSFAWFCNIQLVSLRPLTDETSLAILRRVVHDSSIMGHNSCRENVKSIFATLSAFSPLHHSSLTGTSIGNVATEDSFTESLSKPYDIASFIIKS